MYDIAARLPTIDVLQERCKALAVLERIIDGGAPYYVYTPTWGKDEAALMSNGSGDEWAVVFTADGAFIRVFDHESTMSPYRDPDHELWPGLIDGIPVVLRPQLEEPAFCDETGQFIATAVLWRLAGDDRWHAGEGITFPQLRGPYDDTGPDGSGMLEILLDDIVDRFVEFARDYYEIGVDRAMVEHVVAQQPLTDTVIRAQTLTSPSPICARTSPRSVTRSPRRSGTLGSPSARHAPGTPGRRHEPCAAALGHNAMGR